MADWFSSFANQAIKFADDLADSLVTQANEAQADLQEQQRKLKSEADNKQQIQSAHHFLPWETMVESRQILSKTLMENILSLSINEKNFSSTASNGKEVNFSIEDFAPTAMKMIELDTNLARMHAKLSPKMNEEHFWFNYYCRIVYLRMVSGIEGLDAQKSAEKWNRDEIISPSNSSKPPTVSTMTKGSAPTSKHLLSSNALQLTPGSNSNKPIDTSSTISGKSTTSQAKSNNAMSSPEQVNLEELGLDDLDLEDLKDLELLGEEMMFDGEEFENIGSSECNDEDLEAQIAKELEDVSEDTN
jgi:hypothetical protein